MRMYIKFMFAQLNIWIQVNITAGNVIVIILINVYDLIISNERVICLIPELITGGMFLCTLGRARTERTNNLSPGVFLSRYARRIKSIKLINIICRIAARTALPNFNFRICSIRSTKLQMEAQITRSFQCCYQCARVKVFFLLPAPIFIQTSGNAWTRVGSRRNIRQPSDPTFADLAARWFTLAIIISSFTQIRIRTAVYRPTLAPLYRSISA